MTNIGDNRLIDYFFIGGLSLHALSGEDEKSAKLNDVGSNPIEHVYLGEVLARYPFTEHSNAPFNAGNIMSFCFPDRITLKASYAAPLFHTFALTNELGTRSYGACLIFYEPLPSTSMGKLQERFDSYLREKFEGKKTPTLPSRLFALHCIGLLASYPFISLFKDLLCEMYKLSQNEYHLPMESVIVNYCSEIPLPPPGKVEVQVTGRDGPLYISRTPVNYFHPLIMDYSLDLLFCKLTPAKIIRLFTHALLEKRIIFLADQYSTLHIAAESICALLFPLYWQHVYIPLLPVSMISFIQAPMPYIVGIHSKYKAMAMQEAGIHEDLIYVDLDRGQVIEAPMSSSISLPDYMYRKLLARIQASAYVDNRHLSSAMPGFSDQPYRLVSENNTKAALSYSPIRCVSSNMSTNPEGPIPGTVLSPLQSSSMAHPWASVSGSSIDMDPSSLSLSSLAFNPFKMRSASVPGGMDKLSTSNTPPLSGGHRLQQKRASAQRYCSACGRAIAAFSTSMECSDCGLVFHKTKCASGAGECGPRFDLVLIREAFLSVFVNFLKRYREFLPASVNADFDAPKFVASFPDADYQEFVRAMCTTQAMTQFIIERVERDSSDFEVLFFDEQIKKKMNRMSMSRLAPAKSTPFLDDSSFAVSSTYVALAPEAPSDTSSTSEPPLEADIPSWFEVNVVGVRNQDSTDSILLPESRSLRLRRFPTTLRNELCKPRPVTPLVDDAALVKLKAHTSALVRESRLAQIQRKKAFKTFTALPEDLSALDKNTRIYLIRMAMSCVHQQIESVVLPEAELKTASVATLENVVSTLLNQQRLLIEALDHTGEGSEDESDIHTVFRMLMQQIAVHQEYLDKARAAQDVNSSSEHVHSQTASNQPPPPQVLVSEDGDETGLRGLASQLVVRPTMLSRARGTSGSNSPASEREGNKSPLARIFTGTRGSTPIS